MICKFVECNIADTYWCECIHCGRQLEGFMKAEDLDKLRICCQVPKVEQNPKRSVATKSK